MVALSSASCGTILGTTDDNKMYHDRVVGEKTRAVRIHVQYS